ncbi:MAG: GDP-L-fucose synthase [SAR202 cluster bacterium]|nr:GDP-L-fucose synthase [SAR202 cluster bacterium]
MKKVLLTGATGFLGKNLTKVLSSQYDLHGIGSNFDLRSQEICNKLIRDGGFDIVVHAAGSVGGILANRENPGKFMYENLIMGANIIEASRIYSVGKFILLGTVCAYPKFTPVPFEEKRIWSGYPEETNAPYGIAKKTLMKLLETYHEQYKMNCVNLIPVNMYGPHDHFNLTSSHVIPALILKFYNAMKNGDREVRVWGTGEASREFLFALDCAEAVRLAIEKDVDPEPINVGTGKEIKIKDLVTEIGEQMGYEGRIVWESDKPDGQPRRCLDTTRAKARLGFEAKTDFQTGLKQTIEWFLGEQKCT